MSHYHTSRANITIGLPRPTLPELVPDSDSESGTPLVTPIYANFGNKSNPTHGTSANQGIPTQLDSPTCDGYNHLDKRLLEEGGRNCPPAPRIDNGSFESSFGLDIPGFKDDYRYAFNKTSTHLQHSLGSEDFNPTEVKRAKTAPTCEDPKDRYAICTVPRTPRLDTGSWSSSTGNVAPIAHWSGNLEKRAFWCLSQLHSVTPSASVRSTLSQYVGSDGQAKPVEQLTPGASTRTAWNLGLGLTLDDIAEPDGCGANVGELSMEFAEDSFFDLDTDLSYCSTADTTLNTTTETIPDLAMPCPNSPVGSASQASGPELGITPQLRMLSLQGPGNVKRQRAQYSPMLGSGTRLAYITGFSSETDVACLIRRLRMDEHGELCGLSNRATQEFVPGEYSLIKEARGRSGHQMADAPIFALLPPIEL